MSPITLPLAELKPALTGLAKVINRHSALPVLISDGTVIFSLKPLLSGGSLQAAEFAEKHGKPLLHIHTGTRGAAKKLTGFVQDNGTGTLNVAGPRASSEPTIAAFVSMVLDQAFPMLLA